MADNQAQNSTCQFSTFYIADRLYGIDVMRVQEVTRPMTILPVPLSASHVCGLINLRGQIAIAVSLRELFGIGGEPPQEQMNVVCHSDGLLFSFLVDQIGDVVDADPSSFEATPETVSAGMRRFMDGVYKFSHSLLSVVKIDQVIEEVNSNKQ